MHHEGVTSLPVLDNHKNVIGNISHVDTRVWAIRLPNSSMTDSVDCSSSQAQPPFLFSNQAVHISSTSSFRKEACMTAETRTQSFTSPHTAPSPIPLPNSSPHVLIACGSLMHHHENLPSHRHQHSSQPLQCPHYQHTKTEPPRHLVRHTRPQAQASRSVLRKLQARP